LIVAEVAGDETMRFRLLETLREFANEQLTAEERETLARQHALHFAGVANRAESHLDGPEQATWLGRLEDEHDNLRAALKWSVEQEPGIAFALAGALWPFWAARGHVAEGAERLSALLTMPEAAEPASGGAKLLNGAGVLQWLCGDYSRARHLLEESLARFRQQNDTPGIASVLGNLGLVLWNQNESAAASALFEERLALCRAAGDRAGIASSLENLALIALNDHQDHERATELYEESLGIFRDLGHQQAIAFLLNHLGNVARMRKTPDRARQRYGESLTLFRELRHREGIANVLTNFGRLAEEQGDWAGALAHHQESLAMRRELGNQGGIARSLDYLGVVTHRLGECGRARAYLEQSLALQRAIGQKEIWANTLYNLGCVVMDQNDSAEAVRRFAESFALRQELGDSTRAACCLERLANLAVGQQQWEQAACFLGARQAVLTTQGGAEVPAPSPTSDPDTAATWAALGEEAFARAWTAGWAAPAKQVPAAAAAIMRHGSDLSEHAKRRRSPKNRKQRSDL
jgi:tetratricopeptide (TPR) repeat protein